MEQQFRDEHREAGSGWSRFLLWLGAIRDLATSIPAQFGHEILADARYAFRLDRRRSSSLLFAVAALGLSMGISIGVFSVMNALLLRGLPFSRPSELVELWLSPMNAAYGRTMFA